MMHSPQHPEARPAVFERSMLVGREHEMKKLTELVASREKVVVLFGPAGMGKSRLLRELVHQAPAKMNWYCDLSTVQTEADTIRAILEEVGLAGVGLEDGGRASAEGFKRAIRGLKIQSERLLVLDNCDHVMDILHAWLPWVEEVKGLVVMFGCRSQAACLGGVRVHLQPMALASARELFVNSVRLRRPGFGQALSQDADLDELIEALDRCPLSLELAASRINVLSPHAMLQRMDQRLSLLREAGAHAHERARTLERALRWGWDLLEEPAQLTLAQCAVFEGGFTLEQAEQIVDLGPEHDSLSVLDWLDALVSTSWLQSHISQSLGGELRFTMLEGARAFALAQLDTHPERAQATRARHTRHFLERSQQWEALALTKPGELGLQRLAVERANLLAAARREDTPHEDALKLVYALRWNMLFEMPCEQSLGLLQEFATYADLNPHCFTQWEILRAHLHLARGRHARATQHAAHALAIASDHAPSLLPEALLAQATVLAAQDPQGALALAQRAADSARLQGDGILHARALAQAGSCALKSFQLQEAHALFDHSLHLLRGKAAPFLLSEPLQGLAIILCRQGQLERGAQALEEILRLHLRPCHSAGIASTLHQLAIVRAHMGHAKEGIEALQQADALWKRLGFDACRVSGLCHLGLIQLEDGSHAQATETLNLAASLLSPNADDLHHAGLLALGFALSEWTRGDLDQARTHIEKACAHLRPHLEADATMVALAVSIALESLAPGTEPLEACTTMRHLDQIILQLCQSDTYFRGVGGVSKAVAQEFLHGPDDAPSPQPVVSSVFSRLLRGRFKETQRRSECAVLAAHPDGSWFQVGQGQVQDLSTRKAMRYILAHLISLHPSGEPASVDDLIAAGWPGDKILRSAGAARVYTAIRSLRDLGLEPLLVTIEQGYALDPACSLERLTLSYQDVVVRTA